MDLLNERNWDLLLQTIDNGNVVPVIGKELLRMNISDDQELIQDFILKKLSEKFEVNYSKDMNYLPIVHKITEQNFKNKIQKLSSNDTTDIYFEINSILKDIKLTSSEPLKKLLSIDKFSFILSATFDPVVENTLSNIYPEIRSYSYSKSSKHDIPQDFFEIKNPILYYLFGKVNKIKSSYVVTEDDLLEFLHCWHNEDSRPKNLSNYLKNKFLLVIGCDYPNWLFRFLWYSMKNFSLPSEDETVQGLVSHSTLNRDYELVYFLSRMQTYVYEDSIRFIDELTYRWNNYLTEKKQIAKGDDIEIFISYAHEDLGTAEKIAKIFRDNGAKIWFDKSGLHSGDEYSNKIENNIQKAKRFVPILSKNTINPDSRFLRREWTWALKELECRLLIPYISPIVIDSVDVNNPLIPKEFRDIHIIDHHSPDFEKEIIQMIRSIR